MALGCRTCGVYWRGLFALTRFDDNLQSDVSWNPSVLTPVLLLTTEEGTVAGSGTRVG